MALRADSSNARYSSGTETGYRPIANHARETTRPYSAGAIVKLLAVEGLEGARGYDRKGIEQEKQQIRKSPNQASLEGGGLALGVDLGCHATSQNE
eukprot:scaffold53140_cov64-Phaeocystis_antarctica.AAC.5